ncbi:MAG: PEP-CTERM sorting domain-containing protein [Thiobacillus sp.]
MTIRTTLIASSLIAASLVSGAAHAALEGRDLDGDLATFEAYYDTDLDITWLADANYAKTSGYDTDGLMTWAAADTWAAQLSFTDGVNVYDDWRLPTITDTGTSGCNYANSGTDCGYNVDPASSEMAHLYFTELGNLSYYTTTGAVIGYAGGSNPNSTLDNVGPFTNFQSYHYWSGTEYAPNTFYAWYFYTGSGYQSYGHGSFYALAVRPGDVAAVPEAETYALMLAGLGLIGWRARRRG